MTSSEQDDRFKSEFERIGEGIGKRLGRGFSAQGAQKGARVGKKLGCRLGGQLGRFSDRLESEPVGAEDELGVGGKIGSGVGALGKQFLKHRGKSSRYAAMASAADLPSGGRKLGAKVEKMTKRSVSSGINRVRKRFFKD